MSKRIRTKFTVGNLNRALRRSLREIYLRSRNSIHCSPIHGCIQNWESIAGAGSIGRNNARNCATAWRGDCVSTGQRTDRSSAGDETLCREDKLGSVVRLSSARYARKICTRWKIESVPRSFFDRSPGTLAEFSIVARSNVGYRRISCIIVRNFLLAAESLFKLRIVATFRSLHPRRK